MLLFIEFYLVTLNCGPVIMSCECKNHCVNVLAAIVKPRNSTAILNIKLPKVFQM